MRRQVEDQLGHLQNWSMLVNLHRSMFILNTDLLAFFARYLADQCGDHGNVWTMNTVPISILNQQHNKLTKKLPLILSGI